MALSLEEFRDSLKAKTRQRDFQILCGEQVLYVNGYYLAECSPYFDKLFLGEFEEAKTKTLTISEDSDISFNMILDYLTIVYRRADIEVKTCADMIRLADIWDTPSLMEMCKTFLTSRFRFGLKKFKLKDSINILEAALQHGLRDYIAHVVHDIGSRPSSQLVPYISFFEKCNDVRLTAAVFDLSGKRGYVSKIHTRIDVDESIQDFLPKCYACDRPACAVCSCKDTTVGFCSTHRNVMCPAEHAVDLSILFEEPDKEQGNKGG